MRLSIDVTPEQHQRLKAVAALRGQTIKDYVLDRVLPKNASKDEDDALRQLEAFLVPRINQANEDVINKSVQQIFEDAHKEIR